MPRPDEPSRNQVRLRFGGGLNSRAVETDINPLECAKGQNFNLDISTNLFGRRKPFDIVATATNGERINGFAQLKKVDGTLTTLVQAGTEVYTWDGQTSFTSVGTVKAGARLRGPLSQNWLLTDVCIITDLAKVQTVLSWNGTALTELAHNLGGDFFAKYLAIENELAFFGNVKSGSSDTPHLIVGSKRTDHTNLTVANRPSSSLAVDDPWFLPISDLRPINGLLAAYNKIVFSSERGRIYNLTGDNAKDYKIAQLYVNSAASGDESMAYDGRDVLYGRIGRIESLAATEKFGNVEVDDLSLEVGNLINKVDGWTIAYNATEQKLYCFGDNFSDLFVFHRPIRDKWLQGGLGAAIQGIGKVSPWSLWRTDHAMAFQPTTVMTMLRPTDQKEVTYMGGIGGEIFQLEGDGAKDGGANDVEVNRTSFTIPTPRGGPQFKVTGWINYRRISAATVTLTFQWGGRTLFDQAITISLDAATSLAHYGGTHYYGGSSSPYYGIEFEGRLALQIFGAAGRSDQLQVKVGFDGAVDVFINEILLDFESL